MPKRRAGFLRRGVAAPLNDKGERTALYGILRFALNDRTSGQNDKRAAGQNDKRTAGQNDKRTAGQNDKERYGENDEGKAGGE